MPVGLAFLFSYPSTTAPIAGEISACAAPYDATSMEIANAARAPPKMSSGIVYMLTLTPETARMLNEIPAAVQPAVGSSGISAVGMASSAPTRQTRVRAATAGKPVRIHTSDSQPPPNPPSAATKGGTTAYQFASASARRCFSTRYSVVQFVQSE